MSKGIPTWCPCCGPRVPVDEDGCCESCGVDAMGAGAIAALDAALERDAARLALEFANAEIETCRGETIAERARWRDLVSQVRRMRAAQRSYFRTRGKGALAEAKALESAVDHMIESLLAPEPAAPVQGDLL